VEDAAAFPAGRARHGDLAFGCRKGQQGPAHKGCRADELETETTEQRSDAAPIWQQVAGNRLMLLPDGPQARPAILDLIANARSEICMLFYIFKSDGVGTEVRDALLVARERGVKVRLVVDGFGSSDTAADFFKPLLDAGAGFCRFHPDWGRRYLLRNHQKMVIADGRTAIIGGFNIADPYFDSGRADSWRDLGLLIEGPAVDHLAGYFDRLYDWVVAKHSTIRALRRILASVTQTEGTVRWIFGGPSRRISPYARQVRADVARATQLQMMMAYFAPSHRWLRLLGRVARRGGMTLITAGKTDVAMSRLAAWATYGSLLRRGVRIFEYRPRALHAKLIVADDTVYIGSGNFDMRSLYLNLEVMLRIEDAAFAATVRDLFARELARCQPIKPAVYARAATWGNRLRWRLSYWLFTTADFAMSRNLTSR
jgi:cardiolipin synthase